MMKLKELLGRTEYTLLQGSLDEEITDLVFDSRRVTEGCVFFCLSGTKVDGHRFIPDALEKGAAALVVEKEMSLPPGITAVKVENSRVALARMSAAYFGYPAEEMVTIGITGTKGKTTTSHMVKKILECAGKKVGLIGTNGVYIGENHYPTVNTTPESYELHKYFRQMVKEGCQYMVMEVSSQGLKMNRVEGFLFDYGVFTNISPDHIGPGEHENFEEYLACKGKLFNRCRHGIVNRDDPHWREIIKGHTCDIRTFSLKEGGDFQGEDVHYVKEGRFMGTAFTVKGTSPCHIRVNMPGLFNASNALAAYSATADFSLPKSAIAYGLEHCYVDGRMELVYSSDQFSVIVDYAHNAVSMESLLKTLRDYKPKRLVCVFGCGGNRSKLRRYEMGEIGGRFADLSVITADNSRWEKVEDILADIKTGLKKTDGAFLEIPDRREAICYCIQNAQKGDMIVIIGKGHEDYQEVEGVRTHFLDREEVQKALCRFGYMEES